MIYDDRYPTTSTPVTGLEITNNVNSISTPFDSIMNPYYIGYIPYDKYPKMWNINTVDFSNSEIKINTIADNHPFGYCYETRQSVQYPQLYYKDGGGTCRAYNNLTSLSFINKMCLADFTYIDYVRLYFYIVVAPDNKVINTSTFSFGTPNNQTGDFVLQPIDIVSDIETIRKFINGTENITLQGVTINGISENITISYSNFVNSIAYIRTNDYTVRVQIYDVAFEYRAISANAVNSPVYIAPFIGLDCPAGSVPAQRFMCVLYGWRPSYFLTYDNYGNFASFTVQNDVSGYALGNYQIDNINRDEIVDFAAQLGYSSLGHMNGWYKNQLFVGSGSNSFRLYPTYSPDDVYNAICLLNKIEMGVNNVYNIQPSNTYTTAHSTELFNETNGLLSERVIKNYLPELIYQLRTWQQPNIDITENEFTADDVPPYEPTPGGGGENVGDNITRPSTLGIGGTNGFVTQYALRATDIQELGQILWTSVFDSDYWQNYMFSLALDTGSFSMSSLLSFFVSLKVYPFALLNVPSYSQIGKNMYVGTGIHALEFTNNLHAINNYCDYIPGGSCTVWSGYFFNDYRDYINATYTLYVPYCGTIELNPGDVVHSELTVQYAVDFATGGCVAYVDVTTQDGAQFTIAALPGQMGADVPLTATAAGAVASRFIGDAMKFGGLISGEVAGVAGGVASAMMGNSPSGGSGNVLSGMAAMVGGPIAAVGMDLAPGFAMQAANMIARGAVAAPMMSGGQGFASFGAPQTPYVQIRRGIYPDVTGLSTVCGSRGAGTYTIGELSGFVQGDIKTDGLNCPENEKIQIRQLIAKGIYV